MKFLALAIIGAQSTHSFTFDEAKIGLQNLEEYVNLINWGDKANIFERQSFPLRTPRKPYPVSDSQLKEYLPHSFLAFCTAEHVKTKQCFCPGKYEAAIYVGNKTMESQAVVAADPKNKLIVVSYRGTVTQKNWELNEAFALAQFPGVPKAKVHRGHLLYFKSLQPSSEAAVLRLFKTPKYRGYQLHITGYSLGGSVAAISTPMWAKFLKRNKLPNKMRSFLYSSPRPGNADFARYLESTPIVRYARKGDVVPHLPEQQMGYAQVGAEYFQTDPSNPAKPLKHCANNVLEDPKCGMGDKNFTAINHLFPFGKFIPTPTIC